jgi:hypothetical protein
LEGSGNGTTATTVPNTTATIFLANRKSFHYDGRSGEDASNTSYHHEDNNDEELEADNSGRIRSHFSIDCVDLMYLLFLSPLYHMVPVRSTTATVDEEVQFIIYCSIYVNRFHFCKDSRQKCFAK